jgi:hypothetical protein
MNRNSIGKASLKYFAVIVFTFLTEPVMADDYTLIPRSMYYNAVDQQDEYIAYILDNKMNTISHCRTIYKITDNSLTGEKCSDPDKLPFDIKSTKASVATTIVFTRSASSGATVLGADGLWRLDQETGKVEFCVFGYQTPKCVSLSSD